MKKRNDTLRGTLLAHARRLAEDEGMEAINIRSIAGLAGVATGTVYNYFSDKEEILLGLTEAYWKQTLMEMRTSVTAPTFCSQLEEIFAFLQQRMESPGGIMMKRLGNIKTEGQERMSAIQASLAGSMVERMEQDPGIRTDIWDCYFTKEQYARFIMSNLFLSLKDGAADIGFLIQIVRLTICLNPNNESLHIRRI